MRTKHLRLAAAYAQWSFRAQVERLASQRLGAPPSGSESSHDETIELRGVQVANLDAVARPYWVKRVEPLRAE